jgi:hypothetical protein
MLVDDGFYSELLTYIGAPVTEENLQFCQAWQKREGGNAQWNPFNTTWVRPGSTDYNSVGVQNYPTSLIGIQATGKTLKMSVYGNLVAAFKTGDPWANPSAYAHALRVWSGGGYSRIDRPSSPTPPPTPPPPGDNDMTPEQAIALGKIETALLDPEVGLLARVAKIEVKLGIV